MLIAKTSNIFNKLFTNSQLIEVLIEVSKDEIYIVINDKTNDYLFNYKINHGKSNHNNC